MNLIPFSKLIRFVLISAAILLSAGCETDNRTKPNVIAAKQTYDYHKHVKPILEAKCLACHACYDAPCQLKMQSAVGVDRGASKLAVYDGARVKNSTPTRLYIDATTTKDWRNKGFFSVLENPINSDDIKYNASLLKNMIDLAQAKPLPENKKIPDSIKLGLKRINSCPAPGAFSEYAEENPHGGMPFAVSGLSTNEVNTISTWLNQGAEIKPKKVIISADDQAIIEEWETWLNSENKRIALVARYLYEHLFLGHLYFHTSDEKLNTNSHFFALVRSYTPSGQTIIPVSTVRPFDDPKKPFYYRLKAIEETIVHKTHITYEFGLERLKHYKHSFLKPAWTVDSLPGYSYSERSNPFITYAPIPAKIRYQFLLDNAEFFVRNFIRGPVCRGQIATNVIRDQFWVMFEDPEHEVYINNSDYQQTVNPNLGLPGEKTSIIDLGSEWLKYNEKRNEYLNARQNAYSKKFPLGADSTHVWDGNKTNGNAFLSVFRHHDSASVMKGWKGDIPQTAWLMDYPLLERTYYELVASFDVFGSVSHQAQTRLYFDLIRNGSEVNFLRLLPANQRNKFYKSWYQSAAKIKTEITYQKLDKQAPTAVSYKTKKPYRELLTSFMNRLPKLTKKDDEINRCDELCKQQLKLNSDAIVKKINDSLRKIAAIPAKQLRAIQWLPEVSFLRVELDNDEFISYTILRNRQHSSVAFMLAESLRYEKQKDTLTILPELVGSYPNLMFNIKSKDIDNFVSNFSIIKTETEFDSLIDKWGLRRMNPNFWPVLHGFTRWMEINKPLESGVYDINRYGRW